jgi:anti-sigma factor ChrR (cupin superfamily)
MVMHINADFSQIATVKPQDYQWVKSPGGEVERVMLDRIGEESARATSLVRYLPQTIFPKHQHPSGEEILVLSGVFTENSTTHFPAGWYMRNPHNSSHIPSSEEGALIFVKLRQMSQTETMPVRIDTNDLGNWNELDGRYICPLFQAENEHTYLEKLDAQQPLIFDPAKGIEILVIKGGLNLIQENRAQEQYDVGSWIRIPPNAHLHFQACATSTTLYIKTDHLIAAAANALVLNQ